MVHKVLEGVVYSVEVHLMLSFDLETSINDSAVLELRHLGLYLLVDVSHALKVVAGHTDDLVRNDAHLLKCERLNLCPWVATHKPALGFLF